MAVEQEKAAGGLEVDYGKERSNSGCTRQLGRVEAPSGASRLARVFPSGIGLFPSSLTFPSTGLQVIHYFTWFSSSYEQNSDLALF